MVWRPDVVYGSDPFSCVPLWGIKKVLRNRVVYHEHDSPGELTRGSSLFLRLVNTARGSIARCAEVIVLPNGPRASRFRDTTGCRGKVKTVWNCPRRDEAGEARTPIVDTMKVFFHGSLVPERLPLSIVDALCGVPAVELRFAGYETIGAKGHVQRLLDRAAELGIGDRVRYLGSLPTRKELLAECRQCDAGLALMPRESDDLNLSTMAGASNKPFDYLAQGLALIVSDLPDWKELYVETGYGLPCDPTDPESVAEAIRWYTGHQAECRAKGEAGRQRILAEWNYETQFEPVLRELNGLL